MQGAAISNTVVSLTLKPIKIAKISISKYTDMFST